MTDRGSRLQTPLLLLVTAVIACTVGFLATQRSPGSLPLLHGEASSQRFSEILRIENANDRALQLASFFRHQAGPHDANSLRDVLDEQELYVDEVAEILFASWWAGHDPAAALRRPLAENYGGREPWVRSIIGQWTRGDPDGAVEAVIDQVPASARAAATRVLVVEWFEHSEAPDASKLLRLLQAFDEDVRGRGEAIDLILRSMLESRGVDATVAFVESIPDDSGLDLRREFLGRLAGRIARTDVDRALEFVERHAHGPYRLVMHRYFASQWGYHDGAAAVRWAASLPQETEGQAGTVVRAWLSWLKRDRRGAQTWMQQQEPTPGLEPAYARYVGGIARRDPERALTMLEKIRGEQARRTILTNVGIGFIQRDPISGRAWIESETLPAEVRATILDRVAKLSEIGPTGS